MTKMFHKGDYLLEYRGRHSSEPVTSPDDYVLEITSGKKKVWYAYITNALLSRLCLAKISLSAISLISLYMCVLM